VQDHGLLSGCAASQPDSLAYTGSRGGRTALANRRLQTL